MTTHTEARAGDVRGNLGILGKSAANQEQVAQAKMRSQRRVQLWKMQRASQRLLPDEQVSGCYRNIKDRGLPGVDLVKNRDRGSVHYGNLTTCGSVWHCPICASKISEHRRIELQAGINSHVMRGGSVIMMTLTFPHDISLPLDESLQQLSKALRNFKAMRFYKETMAAIGSVGSVRSLEVTHGHNGWHPHTHDLIFCGKETPDLMARLEKLRDYWAKAVRKSGLGQINEHGFKINGGDYAAEYVAKFGREPALENWGYSHELTKSNAKTGKDGGRTPFDLLRDYVGGDEKAGGLFFQFAKEFKGKRQLFFSPGLKDYLAIEDIEDQEIAAETADTIEREFVGTLNETQWQIILKHNARGEILEVASRYGWEGVLQYLDVLNNRPDNDEQWYQVKRSFFGGSLGRYIQWTN